MTEQLVIPPARVWDKIERILDEQDSRRKEATSLISASFRTVSNNRRKNFYLAAVAGVSLIAGLIWKVA